MSEAQAGNGSGTSLAPQVSEAPSTTGGTTVGGMQPPDLRALVPYARPESTSALDQDNSKASEQATQVPAQQEADRALGAAGEVAQRAGVPPEKQFEELASGDGEVKDAIWLENQGDEESSHTSDDSPTVGETFQYPLPSSPGEGDTQPGAGDSMPSHSGPAVGTSPDARSSSSPSSPEPTLVDSSLAPKESMSQTEVEDVLHQLDTRLNAEMKFDKEFAENYTTDEAKQKAAKDLVDQAIDDPQALAQLRLHARRHPSIRAELVKRIIAARDKERGGSTKSTISEGKPLDLEKYKNALKNYQGDQKKVREAVGKPDAKTAINDALWEANSGYIKYLALYGRGQRQEKAVRILEAKQPEAQAMAAAVIQNRKVEQERREETKKKREEERRRAVDEMTGKTMEERAKNAYDEEPDRSKKNEAADAERAKYAAELVNKPNLTDQDLDDLVRQELTHPEIRKALDQKVEATSDLFLVKRIRLAREIAIGRVASDMNQALTPKDEVVLTSLKPETADYKPYKDVSASGTTEEQYRDFVIEELRTKEGRARLQEIAEQDFYVRDALKDVVERGKQAETERLASTTAAPKSQDAAASAQVASQPSDVAKADQQPVKKGSEAAKRVYAEAVTNKTSLENEITRLSRYIRENPRATDVQAQQRTLDLFQNELSLLVSRLPQLRIDSLTSAELAAEVRGNIHEDLLALTQNKKGWEELFANGERNQARREILKMYNVLQTSSEWAPELRNIMEEAQKSGVRIDYKYHSETGNILNRIRARYTPLFRRGGLSQAQELRVAQEQMRFLSGQMTPEEIQRYNKHGWRRRLRDIGFMLVALLAPIVLEAGKEATQASVANN